MQLCPPLIAVIGCRAAAELAMPWLHCRNRACRRHHRCGGVFPGTVTPACLRNASPEDARLFDYLMTLAVLIHRHACQTAGAPGGKHLFLDADANRRELEDCAVRIVRLSLAGEERRRFRVWMRQRERCRKYLDSRE